MNNIEKAINAMKNIENFWTYRPSEVEAAKLAIAALGKQMPKKVIFDKYKNNFYRLCPNCNGKIYEFDKSKYCESCGQRIDWEE